MKDKEFNCLTCNDSNTVLNPKWEEIWEYYDNQGQFDMNTCCAKADAQAKKYIECPDCTIQE
jgi:hypothetical protein